MFSYIAMMACAALASASNVLVLYRMWAYYNIGPGLGIEPLTKEALEIPRGCAFFHWGLLAQCVYVVIGLVTAYALYIRKMNSLSIGLIAEEMMGNFKFKGIVGN